MTADKPVGCVSAAGGPIVPESRSIDLPREGIEKEVHKMNVTVGQKAPDFEAAAFVDGGFKNIKLSDFAGKWVLLCFYPGDFTFV